MADEPGSLAQEPVVNVPFLIHNHVVVQDEGDTATLTTPDLPELCNDLGAAHGGLVATLVDAAVGLAIRKQSPPGSRVLTVSLHVEYLAPAFGALRAEGVVTKIGRSVCHGAATVRDAAGKLVAQGSAVYAVRAGR